MTTYLGIVNGMRNEELRLLLLLLALLPRMLFAKVRSASATWRIIFLSCRGAN